MTFSVQGAVYHPAERDARNRMLSLGRRQPHVETVVCWRGNYYADYILYFSASSFVEQPTW